MSELELEMNELELELLPALESIRDQICYNRLLNHPLTYEEEEFLEEVTAYFNRIYPVQSDLSDLIEEARALLADLPTAVNIPVLK